MIQTISNLEYTMQNVFFQDTFCTILGCIICIILGLILFISTIETTMYIVDIIKPVIGVLIVSGILIGVLISLKTDGQVLIADISYQTTNGELTTLYLRESMTIGQSSKQDDLEIDRYTAETLIMYSKEIKSREETVSTTTYPITRLIYDADGVVSDIESISTLDTNIVDTTILPIHRNKETSDLIEYQKVLNEIHLYDDTINIIIDETINEPIIEVTTISDNIDWTLDSYKYVIRVNSKDATDRQGSYFSDILRN